MTDQARDAARAQARAIVEAWRTRHTTRARMLGEMDEAELIEDLAAALARPAAAPADEEIAKRAVARCCHWVDLSHGPKIAAEIVAAIRESRAAPAAPEDAEATTCFRWAYQFLLALAKRRLADANAKREAPHDWPAGQAWGDLVGSSHAIFLRGARDEAGVPHDEFLRRIRGGVYDVSDLYDAASVRSTAQRSGRVARACTSTDDYQRACLDLRDEFIALRRATPASGDGAAKITITWTGMGSATPAASPGTPDGPDGETR